MWNESAPEDDDDDGETEAKMEAREDRRRAMFAEAVRTIARAERRRIGL